MGLGWDLRSRSFLFIYFFKNDKNDPLFSLQSRTEDLTYNVRGLCPRLSIQVSSVYCSKKNRSVILNLHPPHVCMQSTLQCFIFLKCT